MTLVALDWNATRARAVLGPAEDYPLPVPLEPPGLELPMALTLERQPQVGSAARRLLRQAPHQVCHGFLPHLGLTDGPHWRAGRQTLDAAGAATHVWQRLQALCKKAEGVVLALPGYLQHVQAEALRLLAEKLRLPMLGSLPAPLAAALAAHAEGFWTHAVLVLDVDDHALTITLVKSADDRAHIVETRSLPALGLKAWQDRLINALADLCVWQMRRDPRDTPSAEQSLYEQLDGLFDAAQQQRAIQLGVQGPQWYQNLLLQPEHTQAYCASLVEQALAVVDELALGQPAHEASLGLVLTHAAGLLPGLTESARALVRRWSRSTDTILPGANRTMVEDFGEGLMFDVADEVAGVLVLPPDAPARAAHALGRFFRAGALARGHQEYLAPLPAPQAVDAGPARLHFQGQDYFLREPSFTLGSHAGCQLQFDAQLHPTVAARHCEIVFDHRTFILFNRSREGTLVNDQGVVGSVTLRPGDWIRLGLHGPTVRFLGGWTHRPIPTPA
jgi:hypothetical protein